MSEITRIQNQDSWKRTQVRIPQDQYDAVVDYAKENNLSLNTAMLELMDKGLQQPQAPNEEFHKTIKVLTERISELSVEAREMRQIYMALFSTKFPESIPLDIQSKAAQILLKNLANGLKEDD